MKCRTASIALLLSAVAPIASADDGRGDSAHVGPASNGAFVVPTKQIIHPPGQSVAWHGRPTDLAISADGKTLYAKSYGSILVIDAATWKIKQDVKLSDKSTSSMAGMTLSPDGKMLYVTASDSRLLEGKLSPEGSLSWTRKIEVPASVPKGGRRADSYPCGIALSPDGHHAFICQSMANSLIEIDLTTSKPIRSISVGNAPWGVALSPDGHRAYVSNWAGRRATAADKTGDSAGTPVVVDDRGIPSTGSVSVIDTDHGKILADIPVGLHPGAVLLSPDGATLFVANANSDSVSVIDTAANQVTQTLNVKPDPRLPWGSCPNALALSPDAKTLYVALGGNNAIAVLNLDHPTPAGFIPTGWCPGGVLADDHHLFIANIKGIGSRDPSAEGDWNSHSYWGTVGKVAIPDAQTLAAYTRQVNEDALVPQSLRAWEKAQSNVVAKAIPAHIGEPSTIEHVIYVIKENRTYDQVLGDIGKGNSDPKLCTFGHDVTPNHHALANQFGLLDNYYCNGVLSADGHAWATEGYADDYLEKGSGSWSRSYPYAGDDSMAFAPTGFIWDDALLHGLSFRNFGEFSKSETDPAGSAVDVYRNYLSGGHKYGIRTKMALQPLHQYSNPNSPGWSLHIPDQQRADVFIKELHADEAKGIFPNFTILYLPNDHTSGTSPSNIVPTSMVADNDLAVGRVVDAVSHSKFWDHTAIFIIEDDPQNGFDHVDGHRSFCLVASPYAKRNVIVSKFYNQTSVLHTIELILGLPPMNQMDSLSPVMRDVFTDTPDTTPYTVVKNIIPIDAVNPARAEITNHRQREMADLSLRQDFDDPDRANDQDLNRIIWFASMGWDSKYPRDFAGAHGRGLRQLHLKLDGSVKDDDDD
ncbi:MAG TPA: bifunctional YncE family protein/alkaline phosphatase family protein [Tepidisphaeraceae bacterium]|jgi:YVTN family beta-propeller protein|nr:bifunctional YncE family protein/alkaline phosphatase family protein [Tepidisphaeraceae bacterium]